MSDIKIIDAHAHLWLKQKAVVGGREIYQLPNGRAYFMGEERQMLPPFMIDGRNSAEVFLSNMDYAQVSAAVITQEFIDGNQNEYLLEVWKRYPDRFFVCGLCEFRQPGFLDDAKSLIDAGFRGITIPGHRLPLEGEKRVWLNSSEMMEMFKAMESRGIILSLTLAVGMKANPEAADLVGMDKLMWGSDYPRTITAITYRMSYDFVLKSEMLTEEEKIAFLGENARRFYGFGNLIDLPYIKNMSE